MLRALIPALILLWTVGTVYDRIHNKRINAMSWHLEHPRFYQKNIPNIEKQLTCWDDDTKKVFRDTYEFWYCKPGILTSVSTMASVGSKSKTRIYITLTDTKAEAHQANFLEAFRHKSHACGVGYFAPIITEQGDGSVYYNFPCEAYVPPHMFTWRESSMGKDLAIIANAMVKKGVYGAIFKPMDPNP